MTVRSFQRAVCLAIGLSLTVVSSSAAAARKCVGDDGRILFTDQPCPNDMKLTKTLERSAIQKTSPPEPQAAHPRPQPSDPLHPRPRSADPSRAAVPMMAKAVLASRFARALADLSTLKIYSMSYMAQSGEWPSAPEQMGLDSGSFDTDDIIEVGYRRDGGIVAYLAPVFGQGKWLWMHPRNALGGANVSWLCRTNVEKGALLPGAYGTCEWHDTPTVQSP